jgi:hypothetical protein
MNEATGIISLVVKRDEEIISKIKEAINVVNERIEVVKQKLVNSDITFFDESDRVVYEDKKADDWEII